MLVGILLARDCYRQLFTCVVELPNVEMRSTAELLSNVSGNRPVAHRGIFANDRYLPQRDASKKIRGPVTR